MSIAFIADSSSFVLYFYFFSEYDLKQTEKYFCLSSIFSSCHFLGMLAQIGPPSMIWQCALGGVACELVEKKNPKMIKK